MLGFADGKGEGVLTTFVRISYLNQHKDGKLSRPQDLALKAATTIGTLVGQLFFGWLADRLGRKRVCKPSHGPFEAFSPFFLLMDIIS